MSAVVDLVNLKKKGEEVVKEEVAAEEVVKPEEKPPEPKMIVLDVYGPINRETVKQTNAALGVTVKDSDRHRLITNFSSGGGQISAAFNVENIIAAWPMPSVGISGSLNASASTLMSCQRDLRLAYSSARFILHDAFAGMDGSPIQIKEQLRDFEEVRNAAIEAYMLHIGLTKKEIERIVSKDTYFNAMDALNLGTKGLIDGIIIKNLGQFKFEILMRNNVIKVVDLYNDDFIAIKDLTVATVQKEETSAEEQTA